MNFQINSSRLLRSVTQQATEKGDPAGYWEVWPSRLLRSVTQKATEKCDPAGNWEVWPNRDFHFLNSKGFVHTPTYTHVYISLYTIKQWLCFNEGIGFSKEPFTACANTPHYNLKQNTWPLIYKCMCIHMQCVTLMTGCSMCNIHVKWKMQSRIDKYPTFINYWANVKKTLIKAN